MLTIHYPLLRLYCVNLYPPFPQRLRFMVLKDKRTSALLKTEEMSTRNLPGGKWRPAREADNLTVICEPIV
jgi:hypothetical protein